MNKENLLNRIKEEIVPKLYLQPPAGYDCCGCSTYQKIVDDIIKLINETEPNK